MEKFVGVFLQSNGKYKAYIAVNGKQIILGRFETFEEAKHARMLAEEKYYQPILDEFNDRLNQNKKSLVVQKG